MFLDGVWSFDTEKEAKRFKMKTEPRTFISATHQVHPLSVTVFYMNAFLFGVLAIQQQLIQHLYRLFVRI